ncbi:hypothetical protein C3B55_00144 [Candidatus Pseudomonas adelgestsugas]|uniref:Uncharacterized protein n=1 Tax=Candidatus Pseudomonas adelgestsugas TaxID=1302376 RepID=A0ABX5R791_9PSED|nr:hypothetical protein C3B55_00144 [Candidatus Pseudomonas adelgestsugas]
MLIPCVLKLRRTKIIVQVTNLIAVAIKFIVIYVNSCPFENVLSDMRLQILVNA